MIARGPSRFREPPAVTSLAKGYAADDGIYLDRVARAGFGSDVNLY